MNKDTIKDYYSIDPKYVEELYYVQIELLKLQKFISDNGLRLAILFEGRDTAGKGSAISRFTQFLNPKNYRVVALGKPSKKEKGQWYFQRYIRRLPDAGEMVFFDRSWYNRAVVEPTMGFCSNEQYELFMSQLNAVEKLLIEDGIKLIKFWFSIDMLEQKERIRRRLDSPLFNWKVSPVDLAAQDKWTDFTYYKAEMFKRTTTLDCPWQIVRGNTREESRIEAIRYILSLYNYTNKDENLRSYDPTKVVTFDESNLGLTEPLHPKNSR